MTLLLVKEKVCGRRGIGHIEAGIQNEWYGYRSDWIYTIGLAGMYGFGVGCCPPELLPDGFAPLSPGTLDPTRRHPDFGNYIHLPSASIMCYLPKHRVRLNGQSTTHHPYQSVRVLISDSESTHEVARLFKDKNKELAGVFVDKYMISNGKDDGSGQPNHAAITGGPPGPAPGGEPQLGGIAVSRPRHWPCSTGTAGTPVQHSTIANLTSTALNSSNTTAPTANNAGIWAACASRGDTFFPAPTWLYSQIAFLSLAHSQVLQDESVSTGAAIPGATSQAAWMDVQPFAPKGNNNNGSDIQKTSLQFARIGYEGATPEGFAGFNSRAFNAAAGVMGSSEGVAHTTHNGQLSGIVDVNGNMWETAPGLTSTAIAGQANYRLYPASLAWSAVSEIGDITGATGVISLIADTNNDGIWWDNAVSQGNPAIWKHLQPRTPNGPWHPTASFIDSNAAQVTKRAMTDCLIPTELGAFADESTGAVANNNFGGDGFRHGLVPNLIPLYGGRWVNGNSAGVCCVNLQNGSTNASWYHGVRAVNLVTP